MKTLFFLLLFVVTFASCKNEVIDVSDFQQCSREITINQIGAGKDDIILIADYRVYFNPESFEIISVVKQYPHTPFTEIEKCNFVILLYYYIIPNPI